MKYNKLRARWSKKEKDILYSFPRGCDGSYLNRIFTQNDRGFNLPQLSFLEDLEERGYDLATLKFEIKLKVDNTPPVV